MAAFASLGLPGFTAKTVASLFYYLRWLVPAFTLGPPAAGGAPRPAGPGRSISLVTAVAATAALLAAVGAVPLYRLVEQTLQR